MILCVCETLWVDILQFLIVCGPAEFREFDHGSTRGWWSKLGGVNAQEFGGMMSWRVEFFSSIF
jgi:hypothetical protein